MSILAIGVNIQNLLVLYLMSNLLVLGAYVLTDTMSVEMTVIAVALVAYLKNFTKLDRTLNLGSKLFKVTRTESMASSIGMYLLDLGFMYLMLAQWAAEPTAVYDLVDNWLLYILIVVPIAGLMAAWIEKLFASVAQPEDFSRTRKVMLSLFVVVTTVISGGLFWVIEDVLS